MSVLPDSELIAWAESGGVVPFELGNVNPASIDLRLGNKIRVPDSVWQHLTVDAIKCLIRNGAIEHIPKWSEEREFSEYWLMPGEFVLTHSLEVTSLTLNEVGILFSKSSWGRKGLEHLHAGYGDPKFSGQWTWELKNMASWPLRLVPGERIMQLVLVTLTGRPDRGYDEVGHYQGQRGAVVAIEEL